MQPASHGDTVKVNLIGALKDGTVFISSKDQSPYKFTVGKGEILPGIEQAVVGMHPGETKDVKIPPAKAYGNRREDMVAEVEKKQIMGNKEPKIGERVKLTYGKDQELSTIVTKVSREKVILDGNHPLAGKDVFFRVELVEIV